VLVGFRLDLRLDFLLGVDFGLCLLGDVHLCRGDHLNLCLCLLADIDMRRGDHFNLCGRLLADIDVCRGNDVRLCLGIHLGVVLDVGIGLDFGLDAILHFSRRLGDVDLVGLDGMDRVELCLDLRHRLDLGLGDKDGQVEELLNVSKIHHQTKKREREKKKRERKKYLVNSVQHTILNNRICHQKLCAIEEHIPAVRRDRHGRTAERGEAIAIFQVGGKDRQTNNEVTLQNLGENFRLDVIGNGLVIGSQEGNASAVVKVTGEVRPVEGLEDLVGAKEGQSLGQKSGQSEEG